MWARPGPYQVNGLILAVALLPRRWFLVFGLVCRHGTGRGWDVSDLGSWVRLPWLAHDEAPGPYITIPQYRFNETKQHTHTASPTDMDFGLVLCKQFSGVSSSRFDPKQRGKRHVQTQAAGSPRIDLVMGIRPTHGRKLIGIVLCYIASSQAFQLPALRAPPGTWWPTPWGCGVNGPMLVSCRIHSRTWLCGVQGL